MVNPEVILSGERSVDNKPSEIINQNTSLSGNGQDVSSSSLGTDREFKWIYNGAINGEKCIENSRIVNDSI
ncbi:hypothetical protein AN643_01585 [Candidatus Epulonipiscioides saccharophilum]|nr:hypothetical protein AN643_01585 [Epulopiscium sp. SCG-B10WGA-EpuloB]